MKVKEMMTGDTVTCDLNASLAEAAAAMWENDCGILPVSKDGEEIVGVITDRDICMGASMRDRSFSRISVEEIMTGALYSTSPEEDVSRALELMREHKVRRLPVLDDGGQLKGMLSINDLTLRAEEPSGKKTPQLSFAQVMETYKAVCEHQRSREQPRTMTANA